MIYDYIPEPIVLEYPEPDESDAPPILTITTSTAAFAYDWGEEQ